MEYKATIEVEKSFAKVIHELENQTGQQSYDKYGLKRDETITQVITFKNGMQADVKLVITEDDDFNWTEAVLFDKNGSEVSCSEVCDEFFGEWTLCKGDDTYTIIVKEKDDERSKKDQ